MEIPLEGRSQYIQLESEGRLKYFGAVKLSESSIGCAAQVLLKERCAYLMLVEDERELMHVLGMGWSGVGICRRIFRC